MIELGPMMLNKETGRYQPTYVRYKRVQKKTLAFSKEYACHSCMQKFGGSVCISQCLEYYAKMKELVESGQIPTHIETVREKFYTFDRPNKIIDRN
ncbi:MAG: hypothetical protein GF411_06095 [Candidatus Lokiarchaeota archaeon]|nr:hypothetical protein [Candidatus Lokiarchaeota archaeon]